MYQEAYNEIKQALEECDAIIDDEIDINLLLECFNQFANENE